MTAPVHAYRPKAAYSTQCYGLERGSIRMAYPLSAHTGWAVSGKTTALKRICHDGEVRRMFADGVCFLEFGQDATDEKVMGELVRFVFNSGGSNAAQEMRRAGKLRDVVHQAAEWVKGRVVLLVCDDLWATESSELGFVHELKKVLRDAPESKLLVSTRDQNIAGEIAESPVNFEVLKADGEKAREILSKTAFGADWKEGSGTGAYEAELTRILKFCAGLPLALGVAGSGIRSTYQAIGDEAAAVRKYWDGLQRKGLLRLRGSRNPHYKGGLGYVVEASLEACDAWGRSDGRSYDMRRMFKSLCVLEKQQLIPETALARYWNVGDETVDEDQVCDVVEKLADLAIVKRDQMVRTRVTADDMNQGTELAGQQLCVRLHDLVLDMCRQMASDELPGWHATMVQSYATTLYVDESWWSLPDDGYAYENLTRHLVGGGERAQVEALLCDCRWTVPRMEVGGWAALNLDFERLLASAGGDENSGMRKLRLLISRSWQSIVQHRSLFAFSVFGHLSPAERKGEWVSPYLSSVEKYYPMRWLHPLTKCVGPKDGRELTRWVFDDTIDATCVSWSQERVYVACGNEIRVWCIKRQQELFIMEGHTSSVESVAISGDGRLIVSGSFDNTVRRWDGESGEAVGDPMEGIRGREAFERVRGGGLADVVDPRSCGVDVLPPETRCQATLKGKNGLVLGLDNGCVVVCEVRPGV